MRTSIFRTGIISFLILIFLLSSCSQPLSFLASASPTATVTVTPSPTITPTPTNTPTATPTATPQKLSYTQINSNNLDQLTPILTLGTGEPFKIEFSPDGKTILIYGELQNCEFDIENQILQNCTEVDFNVNSPNVRTSGPFDPLGSDPEPITDIEDTYISANKSIITARLPEYSYYYLKGSIDSKKEMYRHLYLSPDSKYLAATSQCAINGCPVHAYKAFLWNIETEEVIHEMNINEGGNISLIAFSPDSSLMAYLDAFGILQILKIETDEIISEYSLGVGSTLRFSPDGKFLASSGTRGNVYLWSTATGNLEKILTTNDQPFSLVANTSDEDWATRWDDIGIEKSEYFPFSSNTVGFSVISYSMDGEYLAYCNISTEYATIFDLESGKMITEFPNTRSVYFISDTQFIRGKNNSDFYNPHTTLEFYEIKENSDIEKTKSITSITNKEIKHALSILIGASSDYFAIYNYSYFSDDVSVTIWKNNQEIIEIKSSTPWFIDIPFPAAAYFSPTGTKAAIFVGNKFSLIDLFTQNVVSQYDSYAYGRKYSDDSLSNRHSPFTNMDILWNPELTITTFGAGQPLLGNFESADYNLEVVDPNISKPTINDLVAKQMSHFHQTAPLLPYP